MNEKIFKYPLKVTDTQEVRMPENSKILCVQVQNETPCLWALVDADAPMDTVTIETIGTGNPIENSMQNTEYIGTYQLAFGGLVFHCFKRLD